MAMDRMKLCAPVGETRPALYRHRTQAGGKAMGIQNYKNKHKTIKGKCDPHLFSSPYYCGWPPAFIKFQIYISYDYYKLHVTSIESGSIGARANNHTWLERLQLSSGDVVPSCCRFQYWKTTKTALVLASSSAAASLASSCSSFSSSSASRSTTTTSGGTGCDETPPTTPLSTRMRGTTSIR